MQVPVTNCEAPFAQATEDFRFATSVAAFGMLLRNSKYAGTATFDFVLQTAADALGQDNDGYRSEFVELARLARDLKRK